jgi:hypothetical protein
MFHNWVILQLTNLQGLLKCVSFWSLLGMRRADLKCAKMLHWIAEMSNEKLYIYLSTFSIKHPAGCLN